MLIAHPFSPGISYVTYSGVDHLLRKDRVSSGALLQNILTNDHVGI
jgi:hypothetical protein